MKKVIETTAFLVYSKNIILSNGLGESSTFKSWNSDVMKCNKTLTKSKSAKKFLIWAVNSRQWRQDSDASDFYGILNSFKSKITFSTPSVNISSLDFQQEKRRNIIYCVSRRAQFQAVTQASSKVQEHKRSNDLVRDTFTSHTTLVKFDTK